MGYKLMRIKNKVLKNGVHYLTSDYKSRNKSRPTHSGIDMIGKGYACDYIVAIEDGDVLQTGYDSSRGNFIRIKHENGLISAYYHIKNYTTVVKKGQKVKKGQTLGYMGNTGHSFGAHLHISIFKGSKVIDPLPYLEGSKGFKFERNEQSNTNTSKTIEQVANEVIEGKYGNGNDRVEALKKAGYDPSKVQAKVNEILLGTKKTLSQYTDEQLANMVIAGKFGNGQERKDKLKERYSKVQEIVNKKLK